MPRRNDRGRGGARGPRSRPGRWDDESGAALPPDRRVKARDRQDRVPVAAPVPDAPRVLSLLPERVVVALTCGRCTEWVAEDEGGRGECLHPGSGYLRPWSDTPACPFYH